MVAEGTVVGVLHDGHELDGVVAEAGDAGEDVVGEFIEGADFAFFLGHADVGFVDAETAVLFGGWVFELVGFGGVPILRDEAFGIGVLDDAADVGGYAVHGAGFGDDVDFKFAAVDEFVAEFFVGEEEAPDAELIADQGMAHAIPVVEIADEAELEGVGGPFAIPDAFEAPEFAAVEAKEMVALADLAGEAAGGVEFGAGAVVVIHSPADLVFVGDEPGIEIQKFQTM